MAEDRTLVLVRHGETVWNREGRYQGQSDIPLSDIGREQAKGLRERLCLHPHLFDPEATAVVSSDLLRAHETAELSFGHPGRVVHREPLLREFRYGVFEGLTRDEIDVKYPGLFRAWAFGGPDFAMVGGESRAAVQRRAAGAVRTWLAKLPHAHVVVVAHGGVLRQLLSACFGPAGEPPGVSYSNVATHAVRVTMTGWCYEGAL